ncbi:glutamyl-tRNA reductase [Nocardioides sp. CFH 31398]|uniref:glutamyl-tRNA reductase n=1 Tax=Nocardioides sp. CFH 31398 TaxID=2919579 RepID=UPI001F05C4D4|nr:glutamyl-tRNA reductase [Nocardioides sp. CFH 31398]MCH1865144.1 glutamyl-tRNA reductase [Nocardioides sp. CFH 31398]
MSVLVVGVSHKSAPVSLLERLALDHDGAVKLVDDVMGCDHVTEATVIATCNRIEVYADVDRFHGSVEDISRLLTRGADEVPESLVEHLYVHYEDAAVSHLFQVASGLESMVVGESQILGQTREALRSGQEAGTVGPSLNALFQQALRVGKRAHAETDVDRAAPSLVTAALSRAEAAIGPVTGQRVAILGAGAMAALAASTLAAAGAGDVAVVNRSSASAERLARTYGARAVDMSGLAEEVGRADLVVSCTGATGTVLDAAVLREAREAAGTAQRPLAVVDLALPRDVEAGVEDLPHVTLVDLALLAAELRGSDAGRGVAEVREIVAEELAVFLATRRQASVTPTVVALRSMATAVVDAEMARLVARVPDLDPATHDEVLHTVRRVVDKLLHQPTVRVKELAGETGAVSYAAALAELFSLHPDAVEAVTRPEGMGT